MTDLREALWNYLNSVTDFTVINAMVQFNEPETYVSFYILDDDSLTTSRGEREYNIDEDITDVTYSYLTLVPIQIDVRGVNSYTEAKRLFFAFQSAQDEMKGYGLQYKEVTNVTAIPNVQNGYVKEGYQFNLMVGYDAQLVKQIETGESIKWHLIDKQ